MPTILCESSIRPDQLLVFFPTLAWQLDESTWRLPIHGWIYRPTEFSRLRSAALHVAERLVRRRIKKIPSQIPLFSQRFAPFLADNQRGQRITIQLGNSFFTLKKSRSDGHFFDGLNLPAAHLQKLLPSAPSPAGHWLNFRAITPDRRAFEGKTLLLPPQGLSVISDIDDTIKISEVLDRRLLVRNTFLRDFACVPQMPALYQRWVAQRQAAFHYVSASPWHLYPFLAEFLQTQQFPAGTFYLRQFRLMGKDLATALRPSSRVKARHIRELLKCLPERRFILIGDSGESDAATYASFAQKYPRQIEKILIRNIPGRSPQRWLNTFRRLPTSQWQIFDSPAQVP